MSFKPDASQIRVLDAPPSARRVVVAGPGAGKTATSVLLIESIAGSADIDPFEASIVYISFSRAAVAAALAAFGERVDDLAIRVSPMTLDSLAWQLDDSTTNGQAGEIDFEAVLRRAARRLTSDYQGEFDSVVHMIVDEGQDFSRFRRELLAAVFNRLPSDAGFTVFGDPLQSIYDFFDGETEESEPAWDQVVAIAERAGAQKTLTLDGSHRARRRSPRKVVEAGSAMRAVPRSGRLELLDELVSDLTSIDNDDVPTTVQRWTGSSAVLCRTNAESIRAFDHLARSGVSCSWRRGGETRTAIDRWVAELWNAVDGQPVTAGDFAEFVEHHPEVDRDLFRTLLATTGSRDSAIDWGSTARLCATASAVETLWLALRRAAIETSTVHQSKGLEWDNVVVVDPASMLRPRDGVPPQPELLFVGLSRAADKVVTASPDDVYMRRDFAGGLWYQPHPGTRRATAVCVTPDHLDSEVQVGGEEAQRRLTALQLPVRMDFQLLRSGGAEFPTYRCTIDGTPVGITSSSFGRDLVRAVRGRSADGFPKLGSVMVEGVETRWSTSPQTQFWLSPRPLGVAQIEEGDDA